MTDTQRISFLVQNVTKSAYDWAMTILLGEDQLFSNLEECLLHIQAVFDHPDQGALAVTETLPQKAAGINLH